MVSRDWMPRILLSIDQVHSGYIFALLISALYVITTTSFRLEIHLVALKGDWPIQPRC